MFKLSILEDRIQLTKTGNRVVKPTLGLATQGHKLLTLAAKEGLHVEARFLTLATLNGISSDSWPVLTLTTIG